MDAADLCGRVAIVTGGGSGLGREIVLEYASRGASVVVASDVPAQNEGVAVAGGDRCVPFEVDVRDEEQVRELFAGTTAALGEVDVLVAAAGLDVRTSPSREDRYTHRVPVEHWQRVMDVNLTGTFLCVREALRHMTPRGSGSIVTLTSGTVRRPVPGLGAYVASKAGIEAFTRVVALETKGTGVRANVLQPGGPTNTQFFGASVSDEERARMHDPAVIRASAAYLATDESVGVTGQSLVATDWNRERGLVLCGCPACRSAAAG